MLAETGPGVTSVKPGGHVIPLYTPECLSRKTNLCVAIRGTRGRGVMPDGSSRCFCDGTPVTHYRVR